MTRVGYLGPAGTYSEEALRASAPAGIEEVPYPTIYEAVMAVHDGEVDRAVVPIENSLEGAVSVTLDTLALEATDVRIVAEVVHPIHHCVVAAERLDLAEVKRVISHPQATAQCRRFLRERLAGAELVVAPSTADAVLSVRDSSAGRRGARIAAGGRAVRLPGPGGRRRGPPGQRDALRLARPGGGRRGGVRRQDVARVLGRRRPVARLARPTRCRSWPTGA